MSPAFLGLCLGILNVLANAALFATWGDEPLLARFVVTYGMIPGILAGSLIGVLAGAVATATRGSRLMVITIPTLLMLLLLAAGLEIISLLPLSIVPTLVCCVILEARTRRDPFAPIAEEIPAHAKPRSGVKVSMLIGSAVMFVVLLGMLAKENDLSYFPEVYLPWGLGCGLALAAPFGMLADETRGWSVWPRRFALLASAFALTAALGSFVRMESLILTAFIPVAAGCMMLERYTRLAPAVPTAIARDPIVPRAIAQR